MPTNYTLIRTNRKTLAILVRPGGEVEVRAPLRCPRAQIEAFVQAKAGWIAKKTAAAQENHAQRQFLLSYQSTMPVLGNNVPLAQLLPPGLAEARLRAACVAYYRALAKQLLPRRVHCWGKKMGLCPAQIKINSAKTRWGSCSGKGSLNFSWRLMMAPEPLVDYVVVHELAHLREMNHSPRFWAVVAAALPDFWSRRAALRALHLPILNEE
jgi:predicted metal-dependent hydrolase